MAKITPENLSQAIADILQEYEEGAEKTLEDVTRDVAKAGAKALKNASGVFGGSGKYAKGWTAQKETVARYHTLWTIWNKSKPGLPHLLEYGHAKRQGGRTAGKTHIAPVADDLIEQFQKKLEGGL